MVRKRMNLEELENIDSKKMFQVYDKWPEIAKESYNTKINEIINERRGQVGALESRGVRRVPEANTQLLNDLLIGSLGSKGLNIANILLIS